MEKKPVYCIYNNIIYDPHKNYGMCTNKDSSNYGKPVFRHECEVTLPCSINRKIADDTVYINSLLDTDELTSIVTEGLVNILERPKDKNIKHWKHGIALRLKLLLLRVSKNREEERGKEIVTSVYHHADTFFSVLNKKGSLDAYAIEEYKTGKAIQWKISLDGKEIANTEK